MVIYASYILDMVPENRLKQAAMPVVDIDHCNETEYLNGRTTDNMICAGYEEGGIDSCQVCFFHVLPWSHFGPFESIGCQQVLGYTFVNLLGLRLKEEPLNVIQTYFRN